VTAPDAPAAYDGTRGAAALLLAVAEGQRADATVILGCPPSRDRLAWIAWTLARWYVCSLRSWGVDPEDFARAVIEQSRETEAQR
jgi:hypothetical protein